MEPRQVIANVTKVAIEYYGDEATKKFYEYLKDKKLMTTKCKDCRNTYFPPRLFCPECFGKNVEWVELPREGEIFSFTTQERALRFSHPEVIGFVEIKGIGRILTKIDGRIDELKIGRKVYLDFIEIEGGIVLHKFVPYSEDK